jgi:hypothetical protein
VSHLRYVLLVVTVVGMVGVTALALDVPHTFVSGTTISADDMNANFTAVETTVSSLEAQVAGLVAAQPRVAHAKVDGMVNVTTTDMADVVVVSIDAPAAGVVLVQFVAQAAFEGLTTNNGMAFQIDTVQGGEEELNHYSLIAQSMPANTSRQWYPVATQRAYEVVAGAQTYRTEAEIRGVAAGASRYFWNPSMTATWYPAGSVTLAAALATSGAVGDANEP